MREPLYNQRFGDIYFSPQDGLAETRHVFLEGNDLPGRWHGQDRFTICETGFGTGLNFLVAASLFARTAAPHQYLDYVSCELYPLTPAEIKTALAPWQAQLDGLLERLIACYPLRVAGFHRIDIAPNIRLTLVFDDVGKMLGDLVVPGGVDAWFLDGFAPAKNPQMWAPPLYDAMARHSAPGATAATFTVAGAVRRGLAAAGFAVEKKPGFGRKKEMTTARFPGAVPARPAKRSITKVAVVGGGLAGTSCAALLAARGAAVTLYEKAPALAAAASGNRLGLYNPRFYAQRSAESDFYSAAFCQALRLLRALPAGAAAGFSPCGALHLVNSPEKAKRFAALAETGVWHDDHLRLLTAAAASALAGVRIDCDALYLPESGSVSPPALCRAYVESSSRIEVRTESAVFETGEAAATLSPGATALDDLQSAYDAVIIANAAAALEFAPLRWLPLHTVRGQVTLAEAADARALPAVNLCYGGYLAAVPGGGSACLVGSTFQKWLSDTMLRPEDDRDNLAKLGAAVPGIDAASFRVTGARAALRCASDDHFPLVGAACDAAGQTMPGLYLSLGHGSHGIISALAGATLLADLIDGTPASLAADTVSRLGPARRAGRGRGQVSV